jgi:phage tail-like protein
MAFQSRLLHYLPPVLQTEAEANQFPLDDFLRAFGKILVGIDATEHESFDLARNTEPNEHEALEQMIAGMHELFDPWSVQADFLPWLASWVALEFPTLRNQPLWDEYQQRRAVADMTEVYRQRGLKAGLKHSVSLHTLGEGRPRIAIDDGSLLLFCRPQPNLQAPVHTLVSWGVVEETDSSIEGLVHPWCLVFLPNGDLIVGDKGLAAKGQLKSIKAQLWRLTPQNDWNATGILDNTKNLEPISICLGPGGNLFVLNGPNRVSLFEVENSSTETGKYSYKTAIDITASTNDAIKLTWPVAMAAEQTEGKLHLYILDRGSSDLSGDARPKIVVVKRESAKEYSITNHPVIGIIEPLSMILLDSRELLIGDGGKHDEPNSNLFKISAERPEEDLKNWIGEALPGKDNPLVAPIALSQSDNGQIYVVDAGLRPWAIIPGDTFLSQVARDAAIYVVKSEKESIELASEPGQLVYPTGMAWHDGTLFIADPGFVFTVLPDGPRWRARRHEFAVIVHFLNDALPEENKTQTEFLNRVLGTIRAILQRDKPAHTVFTLVPEVGSFVPKGNEQ